MAKKKSKSGGSSKKKKSDEAPAKKTAVSFVRKRKRSVTRRNPDDSVALMITDLASQAVPVVVTFAGTHVLAHVVGDRLLGGRSWSKHLKVLTAAASIVGVYFAGRTRTLEKYQTGALVGSTLAFLQTVAQVYFPQISWVLGGAPTWQPVVQQLPAAQAQQAPKATGDDDDVDDLSDLQGIFGGASSGSGWNADLS